MIKHIFRMTARWLRDCRAGPRAIAQEQRKGQATADALAAADAEVQRLTLALVDQRKRHARDLRLARADASALAERLDADVQERIKLFRRHKQLVRELDLANANLSALTQQLDALTGDRRDLFRERKQLIKAHDAVRAELTVQAGLLQVEAAERQALFRTRKQLQRNLELAQAGLEANAAVLASFVSERRTMFREQKRLQRDLERSRGEMSGLAARFDDAVSSAIKLADLAQGRTPAGEAPAPDSASPRSHERMLFHLGEVIQARGDLALAASIYRDAGPAMPALLRQSDESGREVSGPDFLIIGTARAGTAWLKKNLSFHPEVSILAREQHYFSLHPLQTPAAYIARFLTPSSLLTAKAEGVTRGRRLYGEKSPSYLVMPDDNIALCAALFPNARLICVVREPISRAWSHLKFTRQDHRADDLDYLRSLPGSKSLDGVTDWGRFREHLGRWAKHFDPEQIHLVDFDRIRTDPKAVYADVLTHIGAAPFAGVKRFLPERIGITRTSEPPPALIEHLKKAYEDECWDVVSLRRAMVEAAARAAADLHPAPATLDPSPFRTGLLN